MHMQLNKAKYHQKSISYKKVKVTFQKRIIVSETGMPTQKFLLSIHKSKSTSIQGNKHTPQTPSKAPKESQATKKKEFQLIDLLSLMHSISAAGAITKAMHQWQQYCLIVHIHNKKKHTKKI